MSSSSYPYPHIEHKRYKLTFLRSVKLVVVYSGEKESYESFRQFFYSFFKIDVTQKQYDIKNVDALRLRSSESEERYKFSRNIAEVVIDGDSYIDFKTSLKPFVNAFQEYLKSISARIYNLKINKINIWPAPDALEPTQDKLMKVIFSDELLSEPSENSEGLSIKEFKDSDLDVSVVVKYGVINDDGSSTVILDTVCDHPNEISAETIDQTLLKMNQLLFDAYHWAVNDEVIEVMNR